MEIDFFKQIKVRGSQEESCLIKQSCAIVYYRGIPNLSWMIGFSRRLLRILFIFDGRPNHPLKANFPLLSSFANRLSY